MTKRTLSEWRDLVKARLAEKGREDQKLGRQLDFFDLQPWFADAEVAHMTRLMTALAEAVAN